MPTEAPVVEDVVLDDKEAAAAAEKLAAAEAAEAAELEAGFTDAPTGETPPAATDEAAAKEAAEKAAADKVAADAAAALAAQPKYRQVTEDEWTKITAKAGEIDQIRADHRKELDKAFGKVGGLERTLATIQAATPTGYAVEVTDDIVADLTKEFPELGGLALKAFKTFAGKLKGTAPAAPAAAVIDPKEIDAIATAKVVALQTEALDDARPEWREIVGAQADKNPYRTWLATQPPEYQAKLASTNSAIVIERSIKKFEEAKATADKAAAAATEKAAKEAADKAAADKRRGVLAAAVPPRGSGGHAAAAPKDDDFEEGFKNG